MVAYGQLLRKDRKAAQRTMGDLAENIGISVSHISDVELGRRAPFDRERVIKAAEYLSANVREHLKAAADWHGAFELDATRASEVAREVGAALARGWSDLDDDDMRAIAEIIQRKVHS